MHSVDVLTTDGLVFTKIVGNRGSAFSMRGNISKNGFSIIQAKHSEPWSVAEKDGTPSLVLEGIESIQYPVSSVVRVIVTDLPGEDVSDEETPGELDDNITEAT